MKIAIVKYNAGNIMSVTYALNRMGIEPTVTDDAEALLNADKVIFPGVGEASTAMNYLKQKSLEKLIPKLKQPVLGICLGLQLMCQHSDENNTPCLNIFDKIRVKRFEFDNKILKIPHMGWNALNNLKSEVFKNTQASNQVYFVHSYYAPICDYTIAQSHYGFPFSAALKINNFYATQFHPEKSGPIGAQILKSFLDL